MPFPAPDKTRLPDPVRPAHTPGPDPAPVALDSLETDVEPVVGSSVVPVQGGVKRGGPDNGTVPFLVVPVDSIPAEIDIEISVMVVIRDRRRPVLLVNDDPGAGGDVLERTVLHV